MVNLDQLNPTQKQAAQKVQGPLLILAGAGSGKTRTISYRIAHMLHNLHFNPENILAVSFTNKAALELKERICKLVGTKYFYKLNISTFHSLGLSILKEQIEHLGYEKNFTLYDPSDQMVLIREALKYYKSEKNYDRKIILSTISNLKNKGISPEDYIKSPDFTPEDPYHLATHHVYEFYQNKLQFYNALDFDDILYLTVKLFDLYPDLKEEYSRRYQYIMIDEFQDTNDLQLRLVQQLTTTHQNICVVGDDDQAIYGFRGANIHNILNFETYYPGLEIVKLEQNYRSTIPILNLANNIIVSIKNRKPKKMWGENESHHLPKLWSHADPDHEAMAVADTVLKLQNDGSPLNEIAILCRSSTQIPSMEEQLLLSQVPYQVIGGQKFYERKEVKDILAYLSLVSNLNDSLALRRVLNVPQRGIGQITLKKFIQIASDNNTNLFHAMNKFSHLEPQREMKLKNFFQLIYDMKNVFKENPLHDSIEKLINQLDFHSYIEKNYDNPHHVARRKADLQTLLQSAQKFHEKYDGSKNVLKEFLRSMYLMDFQSNQSDPGSDQSKPNKLFLMTLHSSKGLEFDNVFIIGLEENMLPHKRSIVEDGGLDEEKRLLYVGVTRAKKNLYMTYCQSRNLYGKNVKVGHSRFLLGLEEYYLKQDRSNFEHLTKEEAKDYKKNFFGDLMKSLEP